MPNLYFVSYVTTVVDLDQPHITDLDIQNVGGQTCLYSTTLYDGQISSWNINGTGLSVIEDDEFLGGLRAGGSSSLTTLTFGGT